MIEELRIQRQRLTERRDGLLVFLVAKVGIAKVAVQDGHVTTNSERLLIRLDGPAELLPLIPNCPDVVPRIGIGRINLRRAFVILQSRPQSCLLVQRYPELVQVHRILRVLVGKPFIGKCRFSIILPRHVEIGKLLVGQFRLHDDDGRLYRRL